jgi:cellulose synthase/poly-beta-1,6-N-acetylglucosamine synthase-like glycosyltransferase
VIAAHNEECGIEAKIHNSLALDYPPGRLEILIASDGSTDDTNEIARRFAAHGVRLLDLPRVGKVQALHEAVLEATGEILVFSDANTLLDAKAVRLIVRNFADPDVGGVCGNQVHDLAGQADSSSDSESLYWKYDKWLKERESHTGSIVSADGAIYAIRRDLYVRPSDLAANDDFAISTQVIRRGYRLVFEAEALASEATPARAGEEFTRKVRIVSKGFWSILAARDLLNPLRFGFYSLVLLTHKVLRRLTPLFLAGALAGSLINVGNHPFYMWSVWAQGSFYTLAAVGGLFRSTRFGKSRIVAVPFFFCLANAAALVACIDVMRGKRVAVWQPKRHGAVGRTT